MVQIGQTGIRMYHMRHEQSGVYCAEGFARTNGKPGVCFGTAGPATVIWYLAFTRLIYQGAQSFAC